MSKIQPGAGYGFTSSGYGYSLNTNPPFDLGTEVSTDHPFKVRAVFGENATDLRVYVTAGTVNNIVPTIYGGTDTSPLLNDVPQPYSVIPGGAFTKYNIYIKVGYNSSTQQYPSPTRSPSSKYPQVDYAPESGGAPSDTDDYTYINIARITVNNSTLTVEKVDQYVTGSLWTSRIKVQGVTAQYFFARV